MMRATIAAVALAAVASLAGCGGHAPRQAPGATRSTPALPTLTGQQEAQECAALAMVRSGFDSYAHQVTVMAGQYQVPRHVAAALIARAVRDDCPALAGVLP